MIKILGLHLYRRIFMVVIIIILILILLFRPAYHITIGLFGFNFILNKFQDVLGNLFNLERTIINR